MDEVDKISVEGVSDVASSAKSGLAAVVWSPRQLSFQPYSSRSCVASKPQSFRVVRRPLVARLTTDIVDTYQRCNPQFQYSDELNPKRFLTTPSTGVLNDGHDNANSDLILSVNHVLINSETQQRYIVKDILGHGTFGQVAKCYVVETNNFVAVKVIKNQPAYHQQALVEVSILTTLNRKFDPEDKHHIVRIYDYFVFQRHLCIAFELLATNLYELIKLNQFRGLSLSIVQLFSRQILRGLALMKDAGIIHCDLKPENILLCTSTKPPGIKIIDFGSACMEDRTVYSYIQSRYYRSPEVLLGYQYTTAIDMWSFGCIVAELFLGLPLFPGASEYDLLRKMIKILGGQPPDYILKEAKHTCKFFKYVGSVNHEENGVARNRSSVYQVLSQEEYEARELKKPSIGKEYFNHMNLEEIVKKYPYKKNLPEEDILKEGEIRLALIDFLRGLVEFDPQKRWSPLQAAKHPFLTGEPFTCPYSPAPETPRVRVSHNVRVEHNPAGGHWFAAGLSPNISGQSRVTMHNSPHYQIMPHVHAGSYGSLGSHGSYNDNAVFSSSYGSYGDNNNLLGFYSPIGPSGMNMYPLGGNLIRGASPDARRIMHLPHGTGIGMSPVNYMPMSLGSSPSQFNSQGTFSQMTAGSPGHYGPASPARGSFHGSPLGKGAGVGQNYRRKGWDNSRGVHAQEYSSSSQRIGQVTDTAISSQSEGGSPVFSASQMQANSNPASWRQHVSGGNASSYSAAHYKAGSSALGSHVHPQSSHGSRHDKPKTNDTLPDPADWDPNYSEELLLQEDSSDTSSITTQFINGVRLNRARSPVEPSVDKRISNLNSNPSLPMRGPNAPIQAYSQGQSSTRSSAPSHPISRPLYMPHPAPSSSHLGQQFQGFHHGTSTGIRNNEWDNFRFQPSLPTFGPHSSGSSGVPWGRRGNHPIAGVPATPGGGGKDYARIA
ncbi:protein modifying enzyme [Lithospermum erythrorhizon]|uniref:Protein modifying enzyme n=1 Tax=Lithospermum erythrorhizon TaxID=34254 RepID=A0AAV3PCM4_LITER